MEEFPGKVAVVTGAASGIGLALARRFAGEGMKVVLADIEQPALEAAVRELRERGSEAIGVVTDVSRADSVQELADRTLAEYGKVHLLCNNAGVSVSGGTAWERTIEDWQWCFGVNFWGTLHGIRTFVPIMLAQGEEGHVVNTASVAGLCTNYYGIYPVTKAAVISLSEYLYRGLAEAGGRIGTSVLCPAAVPTGIMQSQRNRPAELKNTKAKLVRTDLLMARDFVVAMQTAPPPEAIAEAVVAAVRTRQFWVLPPPNREEEIRLRMEGIISQENPRFGTRAGKD